MEGAHRLLIRGGVASEGQNGAMRLDLAFIGWLAWLCACVILLLLFFTAALDPSWLYCALGLFVGGFVIRSVPAR